jgi:hypothetical protein
MILVEPIEIKPLIVPKKGLKEKTPEHLLLSANETSVINILDKLLKNPSPGQSIVCGLHKYTLVQTGQGEAEVIVEKVRCWQLNVLLFNIA